jgi:uncharacterized protein involved in exopolysaccharide biosynthesis
VTVATPARVVPTEWYLATTGLLTTLRTHWRSLGAFGLIGAIVGTGTALILPSYYRSGAAFQAETNPPAALSGSLVGLASQFTGISLGSQNGAQFFGDLVSTDAVLRRVARGTFPWRDSDVKLARIYDIEGDEPPLRDYYTVKKLRKSLSVDVNIRTGVVHFTMEAPTPQLAQALAESTLNALNAANIDLRQARAAAERQFTAERADAARRALDDAEQELAGFYQRNRSIASSPALQLQESKLKRAVDMAQQVYVQLRIQEEQAAVQEVRNTPAISVIDPPLLPVKRSWPNRRLAVFIGFTVGLLVAALRLAARAGGIRIS